jgi:trimeric autotransporter adhesin
MATKLWRGDAPAVAQVTTVVAANVEAGDIFKLTINGKSVQFIATDTLASTVATGLAAAVAATSIPEFGEVTATASSSTLTLTAADPGVPFIVTATATNDGGGSVSVTTDTEGSAAANEVQTFDIPETTASGDSFFVSYGGETTAAIAVGATAATVDTALEGLTAIGAGNVTVSKATNVIGTETTATYTVTFNGSLAGVDVSELYVYIERGSPLIELLVKGSVTANARVRLRLPDSDVTGQTFTLTWGGNTTAAIAENAVAGTIEGALQGLPGLEGYTEGNVYYPSVVVSLASDGSFQIDFQNAMGAPATITAITGAGTWAAAAGDYTQAVTTTTAGGAAVNEVQTITLGGPPTGGTFTLTFGANTTGNIAYNASAATVEGDLQGLASIGLGNATVTGSAGGPWQVTFVSGLAATNVAAITGNGDNLTGANTQTATVTTTVASSGPNHYDDPLNWIPSGVPVNSDDVRFEIGSSDCLYGLAQSAVTLTSLHVAMTYTGKIGLPRSNASDYVEYRDLDLAIGATSILIGQGEGSGPNKVAIDTGSVQTTVELQGSGGSSEAGIPAVTWRGSHASNAVTVLDGDFGTAPYSDQTAVINTMLQRGGTVALKNTTLTDLKATNQNITAYLCTLGGQPLEL